MATIGHYEIIEELGRGAMGVVFRAFDRAIGRTVAVKVIRSHRFSSTEESEMLRLRFSREAAAAGMLSHPNIVTVFHLGEELDYQFLVMEYVEGKSLERLITEGGPLDPETCMVTLNQLASALDYAHARGVFHRDIKPPNILIRSDGQLKITDFGIARIANQTMTQTGVTMGTPSYMAPEQVLASRVDGRADQFSMAVVMFEMLTGRKPFQASTDHALMFAIVSGDRPIAHEVNPKLPSAVSDVLARGMAKDATKRFANCVAFAQSLEVAFRPQGDCAGPALEKAKATVMAGSDELSSALEAEPVLTTELSVPALTQKAPSLGGRRSVRLVGLAALLVSIVILSLQAGRWRSAASGESTKAGVPHSDRQSATTPPPPLSSAPELKPYGYVNDFARVLSSDSSTAIEEYCRNVERVTGAQIAVALVDSLEGHSIEGVSNRLFRQWGIGRQGKDDGLLLLLAVRDHKDRVEVGYGLESTITDGFAAEVLRGMTPDLKQGNYGTAILAAVKRLGDRLAQTKGLDLGQAAR